MKKGFSLVEIVIATFVFVLAAIPIYYSISEGAAKEVDATKLAMSRKILESCRSEVVNLGFEKIKTALESASPPLSNTAYIDLPTGFFTTSFEKVLETQRKYKDYEFTAQVRESASSDSILQVKVTATWTQATGGKHVPEELTFIVVKQ